MDKSELIVQYAKEYEKMLLDEYRNHPDQRPVVTAVDLFAKLLMALTAEMQLLQDRLIKLENK